MAIDTSPDELDRNQNSHERDYAIGNLERRATRMREVKNAIHRLETGSFGICSSCEKEIHPKRLAAVAVSELSANQNSTDSAVVPPEIRRVERDIELQARRFQLGVRAGVALDPELLLIGAQVQIGPFFGDNIYFRPNVEFTYGEVTALFALNQRSCIVYRCPRSTGVGPRMLASAPALIFSTKILNGSTARERESTLGIFIVTSGLNILGGVRYRSGMFAELKTSVYSLPSPTLRPIVGYNF
ncbi:MAG: hypothetical protein R2762_03810 [Bryobacteraceae bacterium]